MYSLTPMRTSSQIFGNLVTARDGYQFGMQFLTEDTRLAVTLDSRQRSTPQGSVNMDIAVGKKFRPGTHRADDDQIAALGIHLLPAAHRAMDDLAGTPRLLAWLAGLQSAATGAAGGNHRQIELGGQGGVALAIGAYREGLQAMLAAELDQLAQVDVDGGVLELVQREDQGRVVEEPGGLGYLFRQLALQAGKVIAGQLQQGDGQHAALELEYRVLLLTHHLPASFR